MNSKSLRQKLALILCIFTLCFVLFGFGSCGDEEDADEIQYSYGSENGIYGTKVLYRPDNYDYNIGSGGTADEENDYYGQYAYRILQDLYLLFGITDKDVTEKFLTQQTIKINGLETSNIPYIYDSIRYQVNLTGTVTKTTNMQGADISVSTPTAPAKIGSKIVGANTSQKWKWSFDFKAKDMRAPIYRTTSQNNFVYVVTSNFDELIRDEYSLYANDYLQTYLGTDDPTSYNDYSDYVKTLEYVIYSYALDLEPQMVAVTINDNPTSIDKCYSVQIGAYRDVYTALADIKALFKKIGSFVGLTQRQIKKVANWIKLNVIGENLINGNDLLYTDNEITAVYNGDTLDHFEIDYNNGTPVGRDYDNTIDAIVKAVCKDVSIGKNSDGSDVTVDDRFLASQVVEYLGDTFFIADDAFFKNPNRIDSLFSQRYVRPLEYQSAVLMPSQAMQVSEIGVIFKYDADDDGTTSGVYDTSKYIDIIAELNYYSNAANKLFTVGSEKVRVYDGPFEFGTSSEDYPGIPADHGMVSFNFADCAELSGLLNEGVATIGAFKPNIGNGILRTDINYDAPTPSMSQRPLILVGTTDVRKYYSIIEPTDEELGSANLTYSTGRLNEKMFAGSEGCDYLEVTYKVLKETGNTTKNYKFYTAFCGLFD